MACLTQDNGHPLGVGGDGFLGWISDGEYKYRNDVLGPRSTLVQAKIKKVSHSFQQSTTVLVNWRLSAEGQQFEQKTHYPNSQDSLLPKP
jgi:hypothetical protein